MGRGRVTRSGRASASSNEERRLGFDFKDGRGRAVVFYVNSTWSVYDAGIFSFILWVGTVVGRRLRRDRDRRWRVMVTRTKRPYPPFIFRVIAIEFADTEAEAQERCEEILRNWDDTDWSSLPVIGARKRRKLRLESLAKS